VSKSARNSHSKICAKSKIGEISFSSSVQAVLNLRESSQRHEVPNFCPAYLHNWNFGFCREAFFSGGTPVEPQKEKGFATLIANP
jgi:hypothetical protein